MPLQHIMLNTSSLSKMQDNLLGVTSIWRLSSMDPLLNSNLSSCGQIPNLVAITVAKRTCSISSSPSTRCGYRKASPSKRRRLSSWSSYEVYDDVHGDLSTSDGTTSKALSTHTVRRASTSRVLAAWRKSQSWSPLEPKNELRNRERQITTTFVDKAGHSHRQSLGKAQGICGPKSRRFISSRAEAYAGQSWNLPLSKTFLRFSCHEINTRRQVAVSAIKQALNPCLQSQRQGQGKLALSMAQFLAAFMSSAETNETRFREERFREALEDMFNNIEEAERKVRAIQSWIDDAEVELQEMAPGNDIEYLEALLGNLHCHSSVDNDQCVSHSEEEHSQFPTEQSVNEQHDLLQRQTSHLTNNLANTHTVADIHGVQQEFEEIDKELSRCAEASKEALCSLRSAIGQGEVSWLRNLESGAAYLEVIASTVLPLERLYTTNP